MVGAIIELLDRKYKAFLLVGALLFVVCVSIVRYLTGPEFAFSVFYVLPISLVSWHVGRWAGILVSTFSVLAWLAADLAMVGSYSHFFVPILNEALRYLVFLTISFILAALKNALERERALARTDPLTRLPNRRAFYELAEIELQKCCRHRRPITTVSIDIDDFKRVNDSFGHQAGDDLLCLVADIIRCNLRTTDLAARFGGDEFAILLPETGADAARTAVQRLQGQLLEAVRTREWPVTFSIGVVTFNDAPEAVDEMVKRADDLMYAVKQSGKNSIRQEVV
jgi:diguanylate cyclase (GGDEF)-like protein